METKTIDLLCDVYQFLGACENLSKEEEEIAIELMDRLVEHMDELNYHEDDDEEEN